MLEIKHHSTLGHLLEKAEDWTCIDQSLRFKEVHSRREVWRLHFLPLHLVQFFIEQLFFLVQRHTTANLPARLLLYQDVPLAWIGPGAALWCEAQQQQASQTQLQPPVRHTHGSGWKAQNDILKKTFHFIRDLQNS